MEKKMYKDMWALRIDFYFILFFLPGLLIRLACDSSQHVSIIRDLCFFSRLLWVYMTHVHFLNIRAGLSETSSSSSLKHGTSVILSFSNALPTGVKL